MSVNIEHPTHQVRRKHRLDHTVSRDAHLAFLSAGQNSPLIHTQRNAPTSWAHAHTQAYPIPIVCQLLMLSKVDELHASPQIRGMDPSGGRGPTRQADGVSRCIQ
jgi:hypothetical protein